MEHEEAEREEEEAPQPAPRRAAESESRAEAQSNSEEGPGKEYEIYISNEEFVNKLKLLHYESSFLKLGVAYKPIQRHYFVKSTNIGEQFFLFTSIAAWLIRKCGEESYAMPQEFDDPNSTLSNIIAAGKNAEVSIDFTANKLKSGSGESVIYLLNSLADVALIKTGFRWEKMIPPKDEDEDVQVDDDENDSNQDEIEEVENALIDDDDDDNVVEIDLKAQGLVTESKTPLQSVLQSTTDSIAWKQEVDRVAPMLKITIRQDAKDWRLHLEQMNSMHGTVDQKVGDIEPFLDTMSKDIAKTLERISGREKTLNNQLSSQMNKFRAAQDKRAEMRERYKTASVGVSSRTENLDRISEDIDQLKQQIEEQGAKSNDGAPLVKIKQAVSKMEEELERMNVQIGVYEQSVLNSYLKERFTITADLINVLHGL